MRCARFAADRFAVARFERAAVDGARRAAERPFFAAVRVLRAADAFFAGRRVALFLRALCAAVRVLFAALRGARAAL
ncbi:MAG TPA: hypothetical protein VKB52_07045, partial [Rhodanobacteraceae bacterium]|nr:hypothetical protein [Rhodanobacteraceae bacterium]